MGEIADALRRADDEPTASGDQYGAGGAAEQAVAARRRDDSSLALKVTRPPEMGDDGIEDAPTQARVRDFVNRAGRDLDRPIALVSSFDADLDLPVRQQYRRFAFRFREIAESMGVRSIVVTSARASEGKTTTACNLALQLTRLDQTLRVVLVDMDLHRAKVGRMLNIDVLNSLDAVLRGETSLEDAVQQTDVAGLSVLGIATPPENPEDLLSNPNLPSMIRKLEARFDLVLIDTPPILVASDAQIILRHAAGVLLVARARVSPVKEIRRALAHIPSEKLLGTLLNASPTAHGVSDYAYGPYGGRNSPFDRIAETTDDATGPKKPAEVDSHVG